MSAIIIHLTPILRLQEYSPERRKAKLKLWRAFNSISTTTALVAIEYYGLDLNEQERRVVG